MAVLLFLLSAVPSVAGSSRRSAAWRCRLQAGLVWHSLSPSLSLQQARSSRTERPEADPSSGAGISAAGSWTPRTMSMQEGGKELLLQVVSTLPGTMQLLGPPIAAPSLLPHPALLCSKPCQGRESRAGPWVRAMVGSAGSWRTRTATVQQGEPGGGEHVLHIVTKPQSMMQLQGPPMPAPGGLPYPGLLRSKPC